MVPQVQVVSILMIVNGALVSLMGLILAAMGPFMFTMLSMEKGKMKADEAAKVAEVEAMFTVVSVVYVVLGLLVLAAGVLSIVAGVRALKFRGRTFALVALFTNVISLFTCYCAPTSLGMLIYGVIVFFNNDVIRAFAMAERGASAEEIRARFAVHGDRDERDQLD